MIGPWSLGRDLGPYASDLGRMVQQVATPPLTPEKPPMAVPIQSAPAPVPPSPRVITKEERTVIFASSLGTVFEWYDFYLYGSLAAIISKQFFSRVNETSALHLRAARLRRGLRGPAVRRARLRPPRRPHRPQVHLPRHHPDHGRVDRPRRHAADVRDDRHRRADHPHRLRLLQGLALGGEYGGAATYVAEHAPHGKRGAYTSWIQTTATLGLFLSLLVILGCRLALGPDVRGLGLAHPVPALDRAARHLGLHPPAAERVAGLQAR